MGFLQAVKGANNAWGKAVSENGMGTFGPENLVNNTKHRILITSFNKTTVVDYNDILSIDILSSTSEWIKYLLKLKNGKKYVLYISPFQVSNKGKDFNTSLLNFEWWMFNLIYKNPNIQSNIINQDLPNEVMSEDANKNASNGINSNCVKPKTTVQKYRTQHNSFWACKSCGAKNPEYSIFCRNCGSYK